MASRLQDRSLPVNAESDLVAARHLARSAARTIGMGLVNETKLVTAVSELTRNIIVHAGRGEMYVGTICGAEGTGVRVRFEDQGPGIEDINKAMTDGFSTTQSLGLGLPGARRLVDQFEIESKPGQGTKVSIVKWK